MENSYLLLLVLWFITTAVVVYLLYEQKRNSAKLNLFSEKNNLFLESIEKYVEIFNEHNVKELNQINNSEKEIFAEEHLKGIKNEYKAKLKSHDNNLTEEHEMLIDFVTLTLSLLVKTPPNLRKRLIEETTDNEMIKKILLSKLPSIEKHYIPVSLLEIAISKEER
jgi:hypothetical protein